MKNRLLALMALCTATASTMPLWAAYPDDPTLEFADPDWDAIQKGEQPTFYIYHVASGKFLSNGNWRNNWNTELVVADEGTPLTLSYGEDYQLAYLDEKDENYNPNKGYRLSAFEAPTNGGFHELFMRYADNVWTGQICVDHSNQGHMLWDITKQDNGYYRITVAASDPSLGAGTEYEGRCWAVEEGDNGVDGIMDMNAADRVNPQGDWQFVEEDVYEAYAAKKNELKPVLDEAEEAGVDCTAEKAIYDKADATAEEVTAAADALEVKVLEAKYSSASPQNPVDVTSLMVNPSFDGNADGWTTDREASVDGQQDNFSYQSSSQNTNDGSTFAGFFERWNPNNPQTDWSIHQDLNGIPNGRYKLTAYILTNKKADEGGPQGLYVYATSFGAETRSSEQPLGSPDGNGYASPVSVEFDVINGTVTVGFKAVDYNSQWCGVDNFKLEFMGAAAAETTARDLLAKAIKDANANLNTVGKTSNAGKTRFQEVINLATQAQQNTEVADDSLLALSDQLIAEFDTLKADADAYAELQTITKEMQNNVDDPESPYAGMLKSTEYYSYLGELMVGWNAGSFDPKGIGDVQAKADSLYTASIASLLTSNATNNVTGMLTNPQFDGSTTGWTKTGDGDFKNDGTRCAEVWNGKNWEVYQELTGLPQGSYKITAQAFYDPSSGNANGWHETWGTESDTNSDIKAYLFGNDGFSPLPHVMDMTITPADTVGCGVPGDFSTIAWGDASIQGNDNPHGNTSAQYIFEKNPANYACETTAYVTEEGKLRIGIRMSGVTWGQAWALFDNFQVTYLGATDMSGANATLNALIQEAQTLAAGDTLSTADTRKALNDAVTAANAAVSGTLTEETYLSNTEALNKAMADFNDACAAAAALEVKAENHNAKLYGSGEGSYEDYANDGYDELAELVDEILLTYVDKMVDFESMAQIEQYSTDIDRAYSKMVTADFDGTGASLEDAVDATVFIINPSFSVKTVDAEGKATETSSADGWTTTGGAATTALNYEIFNDSCEVHQTLYNMPAGYYRLIWNGFYRAGDYQPAAEDRVENDFTEPQNAEVFVDNGERHWSQKLASIFDEMTERKLDGDDRVLSADLFTDKEVQLYYVIPNNVAGAQGRFDDGMYEGNFSFHVAEGETPTIGVRKTGQVTNDWTIFDNFRLEYYGENQPEDFVSSVEEAVAEGTAEVVATQWFTINGVRVDEPKQRGIYIRQDILADGSKKAVKVMVK